MISGLPLARALWHYKMCQGDTSAAAAAASP